MRVSHSESVTAIGTEKQTAEYIVEFVILVRCTSFAARYQALYQFPLVRLDYRLVHTVNSYYFLRRTATALFASERQFNALIAHHAALVSRISQDIANCRRVPIVFIAVTDILAKFRVVISRNSAGRRIFSSDNIAAIRLTLNPSFAIWNMRRTIGAYFSLTIR